MYKFQLFYFPLFFLSFSDIFRRFHSRFNPFGPTDSKEEDDDAIAFPAFGLPIPEGANTTHSVQVGFS